MSVSPPPRAFAVLSPATGWTRSTAFSAPPWSNEQLDAAQVLADIATSYIVHASKLDQFRRLSEQLQGALDSRVVIEQAKGRISSEHDVTVDRAFTLIRDHARSNQQRLRDVATDIVEGRLVLPEG